MVKTHQVQFEIPDYQAAFSDVLDRLERIERLLTNPSNPPTPPPQPPQPAHIPEGMRWGKVDRGQPVTWSYLHSTNPLGDQNSVLRELHAAFSLWVDRDVSSLEFRQVRGRGDIHMNWANLDGSGGVLGATWMPRDGQEMDVGAPMGDVRYDRAEADLFRNPVQFRMVAAHEIGHAIGLPHLSSAEGKALMNPFHNPTILDLLPWDRQQRNERYPKRP